MWCPERLYRLILSLTLLAVFSIPAFADYTAGMEAYRKAWKAYQSGQHREALNWTEQALQADPENPHAHALLGDLHYLAHDLQAAQSAWGQALKLDPRLRALQERLYQLTQEQQLEQRQAAVSSELFVIRTPEQSELSPAWVLEELGQAQRFLEDQLQFQLQGPITVLVYRPKVFYEELHVPTVVAGLFDGKIRMKRLACKARTHWIVLRVFWAVLMRIFAEYVRLGIPFKTG